MLDALPIPQFFLNSSWSSRSRSGVLNVLVAAMAAYPLAKMRFRGRDAIFYALLATLIVPAQLTYIPSFVLAVNVFHYYDTLAALIFPNLVSAFNIFLLRQAFRGVPNDLIDAARVDGAGEWRIWWQILLPIVRPSLAAVAIFTFVTSWNDFLWPSLMLHTPGGHDAAGRAGRAAGLLLLGLPIDRGRRDDDGDPDPAVLRRRPALLREGAGRARSRDELRARARAGRERRASAIRPLRAPGMQILGRMMLAFVGERLPEWVDAAARGAGRGDDAVPASNVRSPGQVRELTEAFQRAGRAGAGAPGRGALGAGLPLLVAADQEGGQLQALGDDATPFAGNMALGAVGDEDLAERVGRAIAREARAMGVNVVYAPGPATSPREPANAALGIRSFGDDPAAVARLGAAMIRGLQGAGVAATVKHFPGLGDVRDDTHYGLAVVDADRERLDVRDARPVPGRRSRPVPGWRCRPTSRCRR